MLLIFKRRIYLRIVKQSTIIDLVVFVLIQIIFQIQKTKTKRKKLSFFLQEIGRIGNVNEKTLLEILFCICKDFQREYIFCGTFFDFI